MGVRTLDDLFHLTNFQNYFPSFVKDDLSDELNFNLSTLKALLSNSLPLSHSNFMHTIRLTNNLNKISDVHPAYSLDDRIFIITQFWHLLTHETTEEGSRGRVAETLTDLIANLHRDHIPSHWIDPTSSKYFVPSEKLEILKNKFDFMPLIGFLESYYNRDYRDPVDTSCRRRKSFVGSTVRLAATLRKEGYWKGEDVRNFVLKDVDTKHISLFYKLRIFLLLCPADYAHYLIYDGSLLTWWRNGSGSCVATWDQLFIVLLHRGVKYGWSNGFPLNKILRKYAPFLFQILLRLMGLPTSRSMVALHKENIASEYSALLEKQYNTIKKLSKVLVLLMEPVTSDTQNLPCETGNEELMLQNLKLEEADGVIGSLKAFISAVSIYCHPSSSGKWSATLAFYVKSFLVSYNRRVSRERVFFSKNLCGRVRPEWDNLLDKKISEVDFVKPQNRLQFTQEKIDVEYIKVIQESSGDFEKSYRLGFNEDKIIIQLLNPILVPGIFSKFPHVSSAYEDATKRLVYLSPSTQLNPTLEHLLAALSTVTESHQTITSLRLLTQLTPLLLQYGSGWLAEVLQLTLAGLDPADPLKTVQTLTFYTVLFSQIPCIEVMDVIIMSEKSALSLSSSSYHDVQDKNVFRCLSLDETERSSIEERQSTSTLLEEWFENAFDTVLNLLAHATKPESNSQSGSVDKGTSMVLKSFACSVFSQIPKVWLQRAMVKFADYVFTKLNSDSLKLSMQLAYGLGLADVEMAMKIFIEKTVNELVETRSETHVRNARRKKASSSGGMYNEDVSSLNSHMTFKILSDEEIYNESEFQIRSDLTENAVISYLSVMANVIRRGGVEILKYEQLLIRLIKACWRNGSKKVFKFGSKLMRRMMEGLVCVYANDKRCMDFETWKKNPECHIHQWGESWWMNANYTKLDWYIPTEKAINFAERLIDLVKDEISFYLSRSGINKVEEKRVLNDHVVRTPEISDTIINNRKLFYWELADINDVDLDTRVIHLVRVASKGITGGFPDERKLNKHKGEYPKVTPFSNNDMGIKMKHYSVDILIYLTEKLLPLKLVSNELPSVREHKAFIEEPKIMKKLLKLCEQILNQPWASTTATSNSSFTNWLTSNDYFPHAQWIDLPRVTWVNRVTQAWNSRIESRRNMHQYTGIRKSVFSILFYLCIGNYADVRKPAQDILKEATAFHFGIRTRTIQLMLSKFNEHLLLPESPLRNATLSGISFVLTTAPILKRIWESEELLKGCLETAERCGSVIIEKTSVKNRVSELVNKVLCYRVGRDFVGELSVGYLNTFMKSPAINWKHEVIRSSIILSLEGVHDKGVDKSMQMMYLLQKCDVITHPLLVCTVVMFAITIILKKYISGKITLSKEIIDKLQDNETMKVFFNTIVHINHDESSKPLTETTAILVNELLKIDITWPKTRSPQSSRALSLRNLLFIQTYFEFIAFENPSSLINQSKIQFIAQLLRLRVDAPTAELEPHIGFVEIVMGISRALTTGFSKHPATRREVLQTLIPLMSEEYGKADQQRSYEWSDGLRFAFEDVEDLYEIAPLVNFAITGVVGEMKDNFVALPPLKDDQTPSIETVKRIRAYQSLLAETFGKYPVLLENALEPLLDAFDHPYKQIREVIARSLLFILSIGSVPDAAHSLRLINEKVIGVVGEKARGLQGVIERDETGSYEEAGKTKELREAETILLLIVNILAVEPQLLLNECMTEVLLPFLLCCCRHPNLDMSQLARSAAGAYTVSPMHTELKNNSDNGPPEFNNNIIATLETSFNSSVSWKTRLTIINLLESIGCHSTLIIRQTDAYNKLLRLAINGLKDPQTEVRLHAKQALAALFTTSHQHPHYTSLFRSLAGDPKKKVSCADRLAGVMGLGAQILSSPYDVPEWLPETISVLASYGGGKAADSIRRDIEKVLQEFFRTHQDAWKQLHEKKFTLEQLDVLDTHKGRPIYFA